MQLTDFDFELPEHLIAKFPASERTGSRLLCVGADGRSTHKQFFELPTLLREHDLLIFNNTKVIPARLFATKPTGGKVEIFIERLLSDTVVLAQCRASKALYPGLQLTTPSGHVITVVDKHDPFYELRSEEKIFSEILSVDGHIPLPPYIDRNDSSFDIERYQTVYAETPGAVAAPTAGLHFDDALLTEIKSQGINTAFLTLHVGAGTFVPVRTADITQHQMHKEIFEVNADVIEKIRETKTKGGRVIAVGTTVVRTLESLAMRGPLQPAVGETDIFIYPPYQFKVIDALITNFHLPQSTLLMLVSAFSGRECILSAYQTAIDSEYRFFSYGDAMFLTPNDL